MQKITPFLWFDGNAEEAANFYASTFGNSKVNKITRYDEDGAASTGMRKGDVMTAEFTLNGQVFVGLNGGPIFQLNPSVSYFVNCKTKKEIDELWQKLSNGGKVLMPLDKYFFSERYGWLEDRFGVSWQLIINEGEFEQKFIPSLLFVNEVCGRAEEAIDFYTKVFKNSKVKSIYRYEANQEPDKEGTIAFADFILEGYHFAAMDSAQNHKFNFNEASSFAVNCDTQDEVDYYWDKLTADGGQESMCGWLKDKFGVSWQITPKILGRLISSSNPEVAKKAMQAMLKMKKIIIADLEKV